MEHLEAPLLIYLGLLVVYIVVSLSAFIVATILVSLLPVSTLNAGASYGYSTSITLFQQTFGLFDKSFPIILFLLMLLSIVITVRNPSVKMGIANLIMFFLTVFLMAKLQPVVSQLSIALQSSQLLPTETAFFSSSYGSYTLLIFTAVLTVLNFNGAHRTRNRPVMDVHHYEHPATQ